LTEKGQTFEQFVKCKNDRRKRQMNDFVASFFKFQERKTTWQRETIGGITSFVTMAYIIFVNPQIMAAAGMDKGTVMLATCLAAAAGTLLMALYANAPFGLAPGMGINAFFAYTLCGAMVIPGSRAWERYCCQVLFLLWFLLPDCAAGSFRKYRCI
jgi:hypothetical protein